MYYAAIRFLLALSLAWLPMVRSVQAAPAGEIHLTLKIWLDLNGNGRKEPGDNWANGVIVYAAPDATPFGYVDSGCDGHGSIFTGTDSTGSVVLVTAPTGGRMCALNIRLVNPVRCFSSLGYTYKYWSLLNIQYETIVILGVTSVDAPNCDVQ